jgi:hypothetical protein
LGLTRIRFAQKIWNSRRQRPTRAPSRFEVILTAQSRESQQCKRTGEFLLAPRNPFDGCHAAVQRLRLIRTRSMSHVLCPWSPRSSPRGSPFDLCLPGSKPSSLAEVSAQKGLASGPRILVARLNKRQGTTWPMGGTHASASRLDKPALAGPWPGRLPISNLGPGRFRDSFSTCPSTPDSRPKPAPTTTYASAARPVCASSSSIPSALTRPLLSPIAVPLPDSRRSENVGAT